MSCIGLGEGLAAGMGMLVFAGDAAGVAAGIGIFIG
jgi:hypothetical protein